MTTETASVAQVLRESDVMLLRLHAYSLTRHSLHGVKKLVCAQLFEFDTDEENQASFSASQMLTQPRSKRDCQIHYARGLCKSTRAFCEQYKLGDASYVQLHTCTSTALARSLDDGWWSITPKPISTDFIPSTTCPKTAPTYPACSLSSIAFSSSLCSLACMRTRDQGCVGNPQPTTSRSKRRESCGDS